MRKFFQFSIAVVFLAFLSASCSNESLTETPDQLEHKFTLTQDNTYQYEVNGETFTGDVFVTNSLNNNLYVAVDLGYGKGGLQLPKAAGTYKSGHDFGPANGTEGNNAFLNVFLTYEGEKYYAYSSHAYGYLEENKITGSQCIIQIQKFEGDYKDVEILGMSGYGKYVLFVGDVEVLFAGTFKTKDGSKSIKVEKGQLNILQEVNGTTVRYPE